ncbi:MAG: magnesium transporter CorA family protein [Marinilabiliales bacterium]
MIKFYKTFDGYQELPKPEKGCWINIVNPDEKEKHFLLGKFGFEIDLINDILDTDERPRMEFEDEWTLIILRIPVADTNNGVPFHTLPLGIFLTEDYTLTLCMHENEVLPIYQPETLRKQYTQINDKINFLLKLFIRSGRLYLNYLKQINQMTNQIEQDLEKSIKNKELNRLLKMEKCLVYFITSIKGNEIVLAKLRNSKKIETEINEDLLEDAFIETKQALDMAQIYSDILSGMMDAFASVISNNLNDVMKQLTLISIILMIPTLIASIFGMNVPNYMEHNLMAMPAIIGASLLASAVGVYFFRRRRWF